MIKIKEDSKMTKREMNAKVKEAEERWKQDLEELSKHRSPMTMEDKMPPTSISEVGDSDLKHLDVGTNSKVKVTNLEAPIPAKDYDKRVNSNKRAVKKEKNLKDIDRD